MLVNNLAFTKTGSKWRKDELWLRRLSLERSASRSSIPSKVNWGGSWAVKLAARIAPVAIVCASTTDRFRRLLSLSPDRHTRARWSWPCSGRNWPRPSSVAVGRLALTFSTCDALPAWRHVLRDWSGGSLCQRVHVFRDNAQIHDNGFCRVDNFFLI